LNVKDFKVIVPDNPKPVVAHSPTRRFAKGSRYVMEAVESLKKEFDFEFKLIEGMPRQEALQIVQNCDIFIDQLLLGSNGMASCEAMSMGKPVLCHIMPAVYENGLPTECPIISTNPDNIRENLGLLLSKPELRIEKGALGRQYAEKYLDVDKKVIELVQFYKQVLNKNKV
jgi:glycosyltransferase involved in cell wall biosynthesis